MSLAANHERAIAIRLRNLEERLATVDALLDTDETGTLYRRDRARLSPDDRWRIAGVVGALRAEITGLAAALGLPREEQDSARRIVAIVAMAWQSVGDLRSASRRGHGAVEPAVARDSTRRSSGSSTCCSRSSASLIGVARRGASRRRPPESQERRRPMATEPTQPGRRRPQIFHQSAGAVVMDGERCLVVRPSDRAEWVLPKGHLERGETAAAAAVREVREETGLAIEIAGSLGPTRYRFGPGLRDRKRVDWFIGRLVGGDLRLEAVLGDAAFVSESNALDTLTYEDDRALVRQAFAVARGRSERH